MDAAPPVESPPAIVEPAQSPAAASVIAGPPVPLPVELPRLEITAGTQGLVTLSSSSTQATGLLGARVVLTQYLQLGGTAAYKYQSGNAAQVQAFQLLVGPTLNLATSRGLQHAFFFTAGLGLTTASTRFNGVLINSNTQPTFSFEVGKRFGLASFAAFSPSLGVLKELEFDASFVIEPVAFSVFF